MRSSNHEVMYLFHDLVFIPLISPFYGLYHCVQCNAFAANSSLTHILHHNIHTELKKPYRTTSYLFASIFTVWIFNSVVMVMRQSPVFIACLEIYLTAGQELYFIDDRNWNSCFTLTHLIIIKRLMYINCPFAREMFYSMKF